MFAIVNSFSSSDEVKFKAFGTECLIRTSHRDPEAISQLLALGVEEARRIEAKYSRFLVTSELSRINREAASSSVQVDSETTSLFSLAKVCFEQSDGLFDITSAPLSEIWSSAQTLPDESKIKGALKRVGFSKLEINGSELRFLAPGMKIDLGGLGKEYAVDKVFLALIEAGAEEILINFGGDLRLRSNTVVRIGIQHPSDQSKVVGVAAIATGAIATSGDYARKRVIDGEAYSHIINPLTGYPVRSFQSVSVLHQSATLAGIATTTAILLGIHEGTEYLRSSGLEFYAVTNNGEILTPASPTE